MTKLNNLSRLLPAAVCCLLSLAGPVHAGAPPADPGQSAARAEPSETLPRAELREQMPTGDVASEPRYGDRDWSWRRAGLADYLGSSMVLAGTLYSEATYGNPAKASWTAHNGFDEGVRDALRLNGSSTRKAASTASDVLMGALIATPVLDGFATIGMRGGNWDAA